MLVQCFIWMVIGSAIHLNAVLFCRKHNRWGGGGGGGTVSQFWTQIGSWHVNDMRCLEKEYAFFGCLI